MSRSKDGEAIITLVGLIVAIIGSAIAGWGYFISDPRNMELVKGGIITAAVGLALMGIFIFFMVFDD